MRPKRLNTAEDNPGIEVIINCQGLDEDLEDPDGGGASAEGVLAAQMYRAAMAALPEKLRNEAELCVTLSDDATLANLNERWRHAQGPTNVLAFPLLQLRPDVMPAARAEPLILGDVILAIETVRREAVEQGKNLSDHLSHLTVHGVLHLLGWDHETLADAERMEEQERAILKSLGIADPYLPLKETLA